MSHARFGSSQKKVLILGAGYVSAPVVDYLTRDPNTNITVAAQYKDEVDKLAERFSNTQPVVMEFSSSKHQLVDLVRHHDLVISLLPYELHPAVAKICISEKRNMITSSYCNAALQELHQAAVNAGITVLNEIGVDPGVDHMLAMQCFDEIKNQGGKITSFISWCGGIPAPEDSENALRYKFSWCPRAALHNVLGSARYLQNSEMIEIPSGGELLDATWALPFFPGFEIEGFPNRDSLVYANMYGLDSAHTVLRGTIRYKGFTEVMKGLIKLGLVDETPHPMLHADGPDVTWRDLLCEIMGKGTDICVDSLKDAVLERCESESVVNSIQSLGLFDNKLIDKRNNTLDTLSNYLEKRLSYGPDERDMILMRHDVGVEWADKSTEKQHIDLVVYGNPKGYSAMAATVGFPTAIAARMVLEGEIHGKGMQFPFSRDIYMAILSKLEKEGIVSRAFVTDQTLPPGRSVDEARN